MQCANDTASPSDHSLPSSSCTADVASILRICGLDHSAVGGDRMDVLLLAATSEGDGAALAPDAEGRNRLEPLTPSSTGAIMPIVGQGTQRDEGSDGDGDWRNECKSDIKASGRNPAGGRGWTSPPTRFDQWQQWFSAIRGLTPGVFCCSLRPVWRR